MRKVLFSAAPCLNPGCGGRNEEQQGCRMEMRCFVSSAESTSYHPSPWHKTRLLPGPLGKAQHCNSSTADEHLPRQCSALFRLPDSSACDLNSLASWGMNSVSPISPASWLLHSNKALGRMSRRIITILHSWRCMAE